MPAPPPAAAHQGRWCVAALALVAATYAAALTVGFVWDDHQLILESDLVRGAFRPLDALLRPFWSGPLSDGASFYRPLTVLSLRLDAAVWGMAPLGFHATNVLLHLAVIACVFVLVRRQGARAPVAAGLAAGFGLLPRLTESVVWISGRTDVLAALGGLLALALHEPGPQGAARRVAAAAALLAGLLAKEVAIAAAVGLALITLDRAPPGGRWRRVLGDLAPAGAAVAVYLVLRALAFAHGPPTVNASPAGPGLALAAIGRYLLLVLDAWRPVLSAAYPLESSAPTIALGALVVAVIAWGAVRARGHLGGGAWAMLGTGGAALLLVCHLVPGGPGSLVADRFLYLPAAAAAVALARPCERAAGRPWARLLLVALVGSFAIATALRLGDWSGEVRLWRHTVAHSAPHNATAPVGLAVALMDRHRYAEALAALDPLPADEPRRDSNRAVCLDKMGRHAEAIAILQRLIAAAPDRVRLWHNLAWAQARAGDVVSARSTLAHVEQRWPGDAVAHVRVAVESAARALADAPGDDAAAAWRRARAWTELEAWAEASAAWSRVLSDASIGAEVRREALGVLVTAGEPKAAAQALAAQRAAQALPAADLAAFEAALVERMD